MSCEWKDGKEKEEGKEEEEEEEGNEAAENCCCFCTVPYSGSGGKRRESPTCVIDDRDFGGTDKNIKRKIERKKEEHCKKKIWQLASGKFGRGVVLGSAGLFQIITTRRSFC